MKILLNKIAQFFKMLAYGIMPSIQGAVAVYYLQQMIKYIVLTTSAAGWQAVLYCLGALMYLALMIWFLYDLGRAFHHAMQWRAYKRKETDNTIDSGSLDCETSDEAADI